MVCLLREVAAEGLSFGSAFEADVLSRKPAEAEQGQQADDDLRDHAVEAPDLEHVLLNKGQAQSKSKADEDEQKKLVAAAQEAHDTNGQVAKNAEDGYRHVLNLGKGAMVDHAAIPVLVDRTDFNGIAVMHAKGEHGNHDSGQGKSCNQIAHHLTDDGKALPWSQAPLFCIFRRIEEQEMAAAMRVALFGGSFDPPHCGHIAIARAARRLLHLDRVLFAPVGSQPLKPLGSTANFEERCAMTKAAIGGHRGFELSLLDAPQPDGSPNYTADTLVRLQNSLPPDATVFCLMGADAFRLLRNWHRGAELPFMAELIVASRPGEDLPALAAELPAGIRFATNPQNILQSTDSDVVTLQIHNEDGRHGGIHLLPGLDHPVSATEIRQRLRQDPSGLKTLAPLIPESVSAYIHAHKLYL